MVRNYHDEESQPLMTGLERHPVEIQVVPVQSDGDADLNANIPSRTDASHPDAPLETEARLEVEDDDDSRPSTPRFIQDEGVWKRWKWVPYSVRRVVKRVAKWSQGPANPQPHRITPLVPVVQEYPLWLLERFLPEMRHRVWLLSIYLAIWIATFALVKRQGTIASQIAGWGEPQSLGCWATYWGSDNSCGIDGVDCRPFNSSGMPFRCAANCASYHVLNPRAVGDQEIVYRSFVVGGLGSSGNTEYPIYRGDSYICAAAIHAGVISNEHGGCGVVAVIGNQKDYVSSRQHGIESIAFDSNFPLSFTFENVTCSATDMRWSLLAVSAVFSGVLSLFISSPAFFFFPIFIGIFWTVGLALDPPPHGSVPALVSNLLGKFLPAMFCVWAMYDKMGVRRTLKDLTAQVEKTVLWLGACWVGALDNYTLSFIPIQRLTKHDLEQQPGARAALAIIILVLLVIVLTQIWFLRQEGRLVKYLKLYALFVGGILISLTIPGLNLRLHHYILALLFLPGTSMQTRPSLLYQGLLVGLFINGIARWGFDPVLQTSYALRGDGHRGSLLPTIPRPEIELSNSTDVPSSIGFTWNQPEGVRYDGISVLVNDVERFRAYFEDATEAVDRFYWYRDSGFDRPEYFRFAFTQGQTTGDYTKAGVWTIDGEWVPMKPGPSRVQENDLDEGTDQNT